MDRTSFVRAELAAAADPVMAAAMARYMKTTDPFYGVPAPARKQIFRAMKERFPITDETEYARAIADLWSLPHREERYLALDVATGYRHFISSRMLGLYRRLVVEGAWWDFVDQVAAGAVGIAWLKDRAAVTPEMAQWVDDPDMWVRRTAIIGQLKHKEETDGDLLFDFCLRRADETEFFIRKAIGWALREYAKTDPAAVRAFTAAHRTDLSPLSYREATKHL